MKAVLITSLLASLVSAHTILDEIYNGGVSQGLHNCLRLPSYDGPITGKSFQLSPLFQSLREIWFLKT